MAALAAPSPLFDRLAKLWRHLPLRSDVDEIILELLGRFSLEKIYCDAGDKETYQRLVITLLAQLTGIFYVQRLTLPAENIHSGPYLGLLVSWEVILRSVELVLQVVNDGRELLWECGLLRDKFLAQFLLLALRLLVLHPRGSVGQRSKDRRDRFARLHKALERVFDSYPGDKSFLLLLCKELTSRLYANPNALALPQRLKNELPNLTTDLYPLTGCLQSAYILELVPDDNMSDSWLSQFLALRDISYFIIGASVEHAVNQETDDIGLQETSARSRDAMFRALDNMRLPAHLSKPEMAASMSELFRTILPDTLDLLQPDDGTVAEYELDALDSLSARLGDRQIVHRVSDGEMMHNVSQVIREIADQDSSSDSSHPGVWAVNCSRCHFMGSSYLKALNIHLHPDNAPSYIELPPGATCVHCGESITLAREVQIARRAWELLGELEVDAGAINVERHLPTVFQTKPEPPDAETNYNSGLGETYDRDRRLHTQSSNYSLYPVRTIQSPLSPTRSVIPPSLPSPSSPRFFESINTLNTLNTLRPNQSRHGSTGYASSSALAEPPLETATSHPDPIVSDEPKSSSQDSHARRASDNSGEKTKSRSWKLFSTSSKKAPPIVTSNDSSSLSSGSLDSQKVEEISLASLVSGQKSSGRGKGSKITHVRLSQSSTLAIFWTHQSLQVWNVGYSPPTLVRSLLTQSICIIAAVAKSHLAYIVGTRDQKLTLRILSLVQPSTPPIEYRMSSSQWCVSMAIDRNENYVAVGFENSVVRFFKIANPEAPREDRLHQHSSCRTCPAVDTLTFSNDGLGLLASTRHAKTGVIQLYLWRFPFLNFQELTTCRHAVPLHESEDNGISAALYRSGAEGEESLVCMTTWTQSGTPVLADPRTGHKSLIRTDGSSRSGKLGNRIQCAALSPSGRDLVLVNDRGHVYHVSNLNSRPMDIKRIATSKELTGKSSSYAMEFVSFGDEDCIVLAWTDASKATGFIKKIPISGRIRDNIPGTPGLVYFASRGTGAEASASGSRGESPQPVELAAEHGTTELEAKPIGTS